MEIESVQIKSFRNLRDVLFNFGSKNAIEGKNHIGKTNVLQAISWALTGYCLNGSSDIASFIPLSDRKATVVVDIRTKDGHEIHKEYSEKWSTNRGNDKPVMTGHKESTKIDGVLMKTQSAASAQICDMVVGCNIGKLPYDRSSINLQMALVNPKYLTEQVKWQDFRRFIISLVGEVSNDDVFAMDKAFDQLRQPINEAHGDTAMLADQIDTSIKEKKASIDSFAMMKSVYISKVCPVDTEIAAANYILERIAKGRIDLLNDRTADPVGDQLRKQLDAENVKLAALQDEMVKEKDGLYADYQKRKQEADADVARQQSVVDDLTKRKADLANKSGDLQRQLDAAKANREDAYNDVCHLRLQYQDEKEKHLDFNEVKCPKCGYVLNGKDEEDAKADFESDRNKRLLDITNKGKAAKTEMDKQDALIESIQRQISQLPSNNAAELDGQLSREFSKLSTLRQISSSVTMGHSKAEDEYFKEKAVTDDLKAKIRANDASTQGSQSEKLAKYDSDTALEKSQAKAVLDQKTVWDDAQRSIADCDAKTMAANHQLTTLLETRDLLMRFIKMKLQLIHDSTKKVFPDIEFVLTEDNIKEGSWDEVCYPLIKGKKTPYSNGSGSEKIITSLAIIEDIRMFLNLGETVLVFDEGETLDSESIKSLDTESQIITSIVNDAYDTPTAIVLSK